MQETQGWQQAIEEELEEEEEEGINSEEEDASAIEDVEQRN